MKDRIRRSRAARTDLLDIWLDRAQYLDRAQDDVGSADCLMDEFEQAMMRIAQFPLIGPHRDDLPADIRVLLRSSFLIVYRIAPNEADVVEILRVLDGRRDLASLLGA